MSTIKIKVGSKISETAEVGNGGAFIIPNITFKVAASKFISCKREAFIVCNSGSHICEILPANLHRAYSTSSMPIALCKEHKVVGKDTRCNIKFSHVSNPRDHNQCDHGHGKRTALRDGASLLE